MAPSNTFLRSPPYLWGGIASTPSAPPIAACRSHSAPSSTSTVLASAFVPATVSSTPNSTLKPPPENFPLHARKIHSAEWINLLSPDTYSPSSSGSAPSFPGQISPPRSGGVAFSTNNDDGGCNLLSFAGYAEIPPTGVNAPPERFVVNDLWQFTPYQDDSTPWGWTEVKSPLSKENYVPGPRLATALAVFPPTGENTLAVLLGGWDPQIPGTGGVILEDVSVLNVDTMGWSKPISLEENGREATIPGGPTSRHVALPIHICDAEGVEKDMILLHNHRCQNFVQLLSIDTNEKSNENFKANWTTQSTKGECPSSRGLHCAAQIVSSTSKSTKGVVIFGGAAKDGNMSNEAFFLDVSSWTWTKLDCAGKSDNDDSHENDGEGTVGGMPSPRAGACLCPLDENSVLLFGGAEPSEGGLRGLNDVWVLQVDFENGKGQWECLVPSESQSQSNSRPSGRNAATLTRIDPKGLLPECLWKKSLDDSFYILQGGWYPFRHTYNDVFLLRVSPSSS
ncbi:hypothetical protein ACHAXS_014387 [Conticribra weissflogii]